MTLDETIRRTVADEVRRVVREEIERAIAKLQPSPSEYLSVPEAARIAAVHASTIREWIRAGALRSHRAGRQWRIRRDELDACLSRTQATEQGSDDERVAAILARSR